VERFGDVYSARFIRKGDKFSILAMDVTVGQLPLSPAQVIKDTWVCGQPILDFDEHWCDRSGLYDTTNQRNYNLRSSQNFQRYQNFLDHESNRQLHRLGRLHTPLHADQRLFSKRTIK